MGATAQLRYSLSPLSSPSHFHSTTSNRQYSYLTNPNNHFLCNNNNNNNHSNNNNNSNLIISLRSSSSSSSSPLSLSSPSPSGGLKPCLSSSGGGGGGGSLGGSGGFGSGGSGGGSGSGSGWDDSSSSSSSSDWWSKLGILGLFIKGWQSRVAADPQFPFKVLMEELVGVTACVLGDMASRPNFGLNELDFVFSTLVVGSILNFTLMYLLAPTAAVAAASSASSSIFANCPKSHMFEPGQFSLLNRCGTFVYKGAVFAAVGFAAGLVGTALSNGLIMVRKKMDPTFETPNKAPPTLLNAVTWALHMGLSSNLRYQTLNGVEYALERAMPSAVFKTSVVALRCANNVLGGMSFVVLARLTGSQSTQPKSLDTEDAIALEEEDEEKDKLIDGVGVGVGVGVGLDTTNHQQQPAANTTTSSAH